MKPKFFLRKRLSITFEIGGKFQCGENLGGFQKKEFSMKQKNIVQEGFFEFIEVVFIV